MTSNRTSIFRSAVGLLSLRWIAKQIGLVLLVFALAVAWLRVPDASAVDVVGTILLGLVVLAVAGGGEAALLLRLAQRPVTRTRVLLGGLAFVLGIALFLGWSALLTHAAENASRVEGYLNSRFPHSLRNIFSYENLYTWTQWLFSLLLWLIAGVLAALIAGLTVSTYPARAIGRTLRSIAYWISFFVAVLAPVEFTGRLANWTPGHGLWIEVLSLLLRSGVVLVFDGAVVSLLLAVLVALVLRYDAPAGTPDESQPRTVANP